VVFLACVHLALFLALFLSPGNSLVSSWCDHSMLASSLWQQRISYKLETTGGTDHNLMVAVLCSFAALWLKGWELQCGNEAIVYRRGLVGLGLRLELGLGFQYRNTGTGRMPVPQAKGRRLPILYTLQYSGLVQNVRRGGTARLIVTLTLT